MKNKKLFLVIFICFMILASFNIIKVESACTTPADEQADDPVEEGTNPVLDGGPDSPAMGGGGGGSTSSHLECVDGKCVSVPGVGRSECGYDGDCKQAGSSEPEEGCECKRCTHDTPSTCELMPTPAAGCPCGRECSGDSECNPPECTCSVCDRTTYTCVSRTTTHCPCPPPCTSANCVEPEEEPDSCVPETEVCGDGIDNDCDTKIDEGCGDQEQETEESSVSGCPEDCTCHTFWPCWPGRPIKSGECKKNGKTGWCCCERDVINENVVDAECGNGEKEEGEECDDGNTEDGDGCSSSCKTETQTEEPTCTKSNVGGDYDTVKCSVDKPSCGYYELSGYTCSGEGEKCWGHKVTSSGGSGSEPPTTEESHKECANGQCIVINGEGQDVCNEDKECIVESKCPELNSVLEEAYGKGVSVKEQEEIKIKAFAADKMKVAVPTKTGGDLNFYAFYSVNGGTDIALGKSAVRPLITSAEKDIDKDAQFIISSGKYSHLLEVTGFDSVNKKVSFKDVGLGTSFKVTATDQVANDGNFYLDGYEYHFTAYYDEQKIKMENLGTDEEGVIWTPSGAKLKVSLASETQGLIKLTEDYEGPDDGSSSDAKTISIKITDAGTADTQKITANKPTSDDENFEMIKWDSKQNYYDGYTRWGTNVVYETPIGGQNPVTINYPKTEAEANAYITSGIVSTTGTTTTIEGDSFKISSSTDELNLFEYLSSESGTTELEKGPIEKITKNELNALADGSITNEKGTYQYHQEIILPEDAKVVYYSKQSDDPQLYLKFAANKPGYIYRLSFPTAIRSDIDSDNHYDDLDDERIEMLGKQFTIIKTRHDYLGEIMLMTGVIEDRMEEGDSKTYTMNGMDYVVEVVIITDQTNPQVKFKINGETTDALLATETFKLADGTEIAVKSLEVNEEGDVVGDRVEFYLGAEIVTFRDRDFETADWGGTLTVGGEEIENIGVNIVGTFPDRDVAISEIEVRWTPDKDYYVPSGGKLSDNLDVYYKDQLFLRNMDFEFVGIDLGITGSTTTYTSCDDIKYDKRADFNNDKKIDFEDLMLLSINYDDESWCIEQLEKTFDPCEPIGLICTESDGKNYYLKGYVSDQYTTTFPNGKFYDICSVKNKNSESYTHIYSCNGDDCFLTESFCVSKDNHNTEIYHCSNGCEDGACICDMVDTLAEGESKTYTINGLDYDVNVVIITGPYPYQVKFKVNGFNTDAMQKGHRFKLPDGAELAVIEILPNEAGDVTEDLVEFCLNGKTSEEPTESITINGDYIILNENFPDDVYSSPIYFYTGVLPTGKIVRTLINFDLSSLENKEIKKAELVINSIPMLYEEEYGKQITEVHKVTGPWDTQTACWNNQPSFDTTVVNSQEITENGIYTFDINSNVMDYLIEHEAGVLLKAENEEETNLKKFDDVYLNVWYTAEEEEETKSCEEMGGNCRYLSGCKDEEIYTADYECPFWGKCCMPEEDEEEEENQEAVDLSDYPYPFIEDDIAKFIMVLGKDSSSEDVISAADILLSLVDSSVSGEPIDIPAPILDTEVADIKAQNTIIVGGPCVNNAAVELLGITAQGPECTQGFEEGKAKIKLFQGMEGQGENVILLVAGYDSLRTRIAAKVLANYEEYDLQGQEVMVSGESLVDITVNEPWNEEEDEIAIGGQGGCNEGGSAGHETRPSMVVSNWIQRSSNEAKGWSIGCKGYGTAVVEAICVKKSDLNYRIAQGGQQQHYVDDELSYFAESYCNGN